MAEGVNSYYQDPGWGAVLRALIRSRKDADGLIVLRILFLSLTVAPLLILYVLTFLDLDVGSPSGLLLVGIIALSVMGAVSARIISRSGLDPTSAQKSLEAYRTRFFLAFALNEAPVLIAFALCFVEDSLRPYLVALPIFLMGMAGIAPGKRNLVAIEENLMRKGAQFSLRAELARAALPVTR